MRERERESACVCARARADASVLISRSTLSVAFHLRRRRLPAIDRPANIAHISSKTASVVEPLSLRSMVILISRIFSPFCTFAIDLVTDRTRASSGRSSLAKLRLKDLHPIALDPDLISGDAQTDHRVTGCLTSVFYSLSPLAPSDRSNRNARLGYARAKTSPVFVFHVLSRSSTPRRDHEDPGRFSVCLINGINYDRQSPIESMRLAGSSTTMVICTCVY